MRLFKLYREERRVSRNLKTIEPFPYFLHHNHSRPLYFCEGTVEVASRLEQNEQRIRIYYHANLAFSTYGGIRIMFDIIARTIELLLCGKGDDE